METSRNPTTEVRTWTLELEPVSGEKFSFTFSDDGKGTCRDLDGNAQVEFRWDAETFLETHQDESETREALEVVASELFWDEINPRLGEDEVIGDFSAYPSNDDPEIEFTCGSREELERLTALILCCFPGVWPAGIDQRFVRFFATGTEGGESARLDDDDGLFTEDHGLSTSELEQIRELLNLAVDRNTPVGEYLEYNDGPLNRMSGYNWCTKSICVEVARPSFHEMAGARRALREKLKRELSAADLDRLLAQS